MKIRTGWMAFAIITLVLADTAEATPRLESLPTPVASLKSNILAKAPIGWLDFCAENVAECRTHYGQTAAVALTDTKWDELQQVNAYWNKKIEPVTDAEHWGVAERWSYVNDGKGDCEDYVLEKRRNLMRLGWPASTLLITVVRDHKGDGHAVLTVRTTRGDFILDNQEERVLSVAATGYKMVKRQSEWDQNAWVSLSDGNVTVTAAQ